ncbi:MAG: Asp23/Gls24 family envelope stress response protein [Actinomycetota bacterium]|nr:Asp23/Gls24 family envelope stress response protein [Actinomycetota bacterium]
MSRPERLVTPRGQTVIAPSVVERIATRAAAEVPGVTAATRSGLDRLVARTSGRPLTRAGAEVGGTRASVDLAITVRYPEPLREVSARVRRHVRDRVQEMTGLVVEDVKLRVDGLVGCAGGRRVE